MQREAFWVENSDTPSVFVYKHKNENLNIYRLIFNIYSESEEARNCQQILMESERSEDNDYGTLRVDMKMWREKYELTKETVEKEIKNVTLTKNLIIKDIMNYKRELLSRLEEFARNSIDMVNERFQQITATMKTTASKINELLAHIDKTTKEAKLDIKKQREKMERTTATLYEEEFKIRGEIEGFEGVSVCLDRNVKTFFDETTTLVQINCPCKVNLLQKVDMTFESDRETCGISDICTLPDGTIVMTDLSNDCLKRLDESYNRKGILHLDSGPLGISATNHGEVAVTLRENGAIQFVEYTETDLKLTKSFQTGCSCNYICCIDDTLFVTCEGGDDDLRKGHVRKFSLTGDLLGIIDTYKEEYRMFTTPLHITCNTDKSRLYITDMDNKVIALDKTGKNLAQYRNVFLEGPFGISVLPNDNVLITSIDHHSVQQFDDKCRYVGRILTENKDMQHPVCVKFNASRGQILVSMDDCNTLLVFSSNFPST